MSGPALPAPGGAAFGVVLRNYRLAAKLTQEALAESAGFSTVYVGMLERNERHPPLSTVSALARALGLTAAESKALSAAA
ncbi:MAG: helix-turn-helix transcriptional regulator, partial [bacterium]|nr:helix-turn-helix transcriptional regulator [bacterium]